jgi:hypothetical protein
MGHAERAAPDVKAGHPALETALRHRLVSGHISAAPVSGMTALEQ